MNGERQQNDTFSRRAFVAGSGAALAAGLCAGPTSASAARAPAQQSGGVVRSPENAPKPPFDSLRDYLAAMEAHGLLVRFDGVDQDAWEATAIMYHLTDTFGLYGAPVVVFENLLIDGRRVRGPLVGNNMSHYHQEALLWGLTPDYAEPRNSYRTGLAHMLGLLEENDGDYPQIPPVMIERDQAPCKQVVLDGDDVDITAFAFIQGNPGDAGRYINTGSTFTKDPEWGQNFGTYRIQIAGPRKLLLNSEPNQTGNRMLMHAKERGERSMKIAVVLGQDPVTWVMSGSRVPLTPRKPVDELAYAGGLRGKPLEVVSCDLSDLVIPAHCEMVIEGEVDLTAFEPEGPYHETYGYLGDRNEERFVFNVQRITHRRDPILMNSFTSIGGGFVKAPMDAYTVRMWQARYPQVTGFYYHDDTKGIHCLSIRKDRPGLGLEIARAYSEFSSIAKLTVVVDDDLDIMNQAEVLLALGSRWQPVPASHIVAKAKASFFEPSSPDGETTSKIAIDATMQWPEEGGPKQFRALNRNLFEAAASPDIMKRIVAKWPEQLTRKPW